MTIPDNSRAAVRVCAIADIECSRNCGTGPCKRETPSTDNSHTDALNRVPCQFCGSRTHDDDDCDRLPVEQHEAEPAMSRQDIFDKFSFLEGLVSQSTYVSIAETAVSIYKNASKSAPLEGTGNGADAWMTDDGRIISDAQKQQALRDGGASASSVQPFSIALSRAPRTEVAGLAGEICQLQWVGERKWRDVTREQYIAALNSSQANDQRFRIVREVAPPSADAAAAPADERAALLRDALFYLKGNLPDSPSDHKRKAQVIAGLEGLARAAASQPAAAPARTTNDGWWDQALHERDTYEEYADELARAIAAYLHIDIGENSNFNNPWLKALEAIKNVAPPAQVATRQPEPRAEVADDDKLCADRYRILRRGQHFSVVNGIGDTLRAGALDEAIDTARAGEGHADQA